MLDCCLDNIRASCVCKGCFAPRKDSDGIVCLHDIVNNATYQNTETGNFEAGEEVVSDNV